MSEYNEWSDEKLLDEYGERQRSLDRISRLSLPGRSTAILAIIAEISAELLARMRPAGETAKPEAGRNGNPPDYVVTIDDGYLVYRFELNGTGRYSVDDLISLITGNTELGIANEKRLDFVPAQEPPATEEEWEEPPIFEGLLQEGDRIHHRNGFVIPIMGESIGESVFGCLANPYVTKITRRVRKQKPIPNTSNDFPQPAFCPTCGTAIGIEGEDEQDRYTAPDTASALEVARKALDGVVKSGMMPWEHCAYHIAADAIKEIDKLVGKA